MIKFVFFTISSIIGLPLLLLFFILFSTIHSEDFAKQHEERGISKCQDLDDKEQYGLHEGQTQKDKCIESWYLTSPAGYILTYIIGFVGFLFSIPFIIFALKRLYRLFKKIKN